METYTTTQQQRLENAQKRVKKVKDFYYHAIVYVLVNIVIIGGNIYTGLDKMISYEPYTTAIFWGFGLLAHGISVFAPPFILGKDWEEKQIQKYMNS